MNNILVRPPTLPTCVQDCFSNNIHNNTKYWSSSSKLETDQRNICSANSMKLTKFGRTPEQKECPSGGKKRRSLKLATYLYLHSSVLFHYFVLKITGNISLSFSLSGWQTCLHNQPTPNGCVHVCYCQASKQYSYQEGGRG